jgi:hypothetical protein
MHPLPGRQLAEVQSIAALTELTLQRALYVSTQVAAATAAPCCASVNRAPPAGHHQRFRDGQGSTMILSASVAGWVRRSNASAVRSSG